ncbi:hypothetical protein [uncultured Enterovirga sp.]|uniref:hypothetical protein n=1 Tax=uncultured Enterovirga sp. TaxID=2026352 RepID=UPI0035CC69EA
MGFRVEVEQNEQILLTFVHVGERAEERIEAAVIGRRSGKSAIDEGKSARCKPRRRQDPPHRRAGA